MHLLSHAHDAPHSRCTGPVGKPLHPAMHAPSLHTTFTLLHDEVALHASSHPALRGQLKATLAHDETAPHWSAHGAESAQRTVVFAHDDSPLHCTTHFLPDGHSIVSPSHAFGV